MQEIIRWATSLVFCAAVLFAPVDATAVLIDDYSTVQGPLVSSTSDFAVGGGILGGERDVQVIQGVLGVSVGAGSGVGFLTVSGTEDPSDPELTLFEYVYDGIDGSTTNAQSLGPVDLTDGGLSDAFLLDVLSISGEVPIQIAINEAGEIARIANVVLDSTGTLVLPFSIFSAGTADFASTQSIQLLFGDFDESAGIEYDNFRTGSADEIPEPGTVILLASALALIGLRRRR